VLHLVVGMHLALHHQEEVDFLVGEELKHRDHLMLNEVSKKITLMRNFLSIKKQESQK
jgi:hypothetical protein